MRIIAIVCILFFLKGCRSSSEKPRTIIGEAPTTEIEMNNDSPVIQSPAPKAPKGTVYGNFKGDSRPFYAHVSKVRGSKTTVSFENSQLPNIVLADAYGATVLDLTLPTFDRDLLLITTKLKDPNFNKYFLYILQNNTWKLVTNGFAIHKSNMKDVVRPIWIDPENPNRLQRHYSVFNIDETDSKGYRWLLLTESVPIENR